MSWGKAGFRIGLVTAAMGMLAAFANSQTAVDLDGRLVNPFAEDGSKITVLVFLRRDCPVSGRYAPVIQQISKQYSNRAAFWLVYPDRSDTAQAIRKSVDEFGYRLPVLRDTNRALVNLSHAQITPEVAVFNGSHQLVYDGRIDNWYVDISRARPSPTTHELQDAIRIAESGGQMAHSEIRGVGCYIADLP